MSLLTEDTKITPEYLGSKYRVKRYFHNGCDDYNMYAFEACLYGKADKGNYPRYTAQYFFIYDLDNGRVAIIFSNYTTIPFSREIYKYDNVYDESDLDIIIDKYNNDIINITSNVYGVYGKDTTNEILLTHEVRYNYKQLNRFLTGYNPWNYDAWEFENVKI